MVRLQLLTQQLTDDKNEVAIVAADSSAADGILQLMALVQILIPHSGTKWNVNKVLTLQEILLFQELLMAEIYKLTELNLTWHRCCCRN